MWTSSERELIELLARWRGCRAQVWGYSCSHARLLIRFYREGPNLGSSAYLFCAGCRRVQFDAHWQDMDVQIFLRPDGRLTVSDGDRLYVESGAARARESDNFIGFESVPG